MKTFVIIFLAVLFILSISYYFGRNCKTKKCQPKEQDSRAESIKRAKKNLHPIINRNVDRDSRGRFVKRKV